MADRLDFTLLMTAQSQDITVKALAE